jgi:hypothetical protein
MRSDLENRTKGPAQPYAQACARSSSKKPNGIADFADLRKRDLRRSGQQPNDDPLGEPMTIQEVAVVLGCSVWTIRQKYLRSGLPFFRIGSTGKLVFYRKQVVLWILENQKTERR